MRILFLIGALLIASFVTWHILSYKQKPDHSRSTVTVKTAKASIKSMPITLSAIGTIEAKQAAAITPQITGVIKQIAFQAGDQVKAGQLLFEIDPQPFLANLNQTQAILQRDSAELISKQADAKRFTRLVKPGYVTEQQYEQANAAAKEQAALVAADQAQIKQAQIQLSYTKIHAPISGKTGNITIKQGDLVTANSSTPLVTINQLNRLWVDFSIPQNQLATILKYQQQKPLTVEVYNETNNKLLGKGSLVFIDNKVDTQTGTVLLKAELPNSEHLLWPGLTVKVKLQLAIEQNALVLPATAVQHDQQGAFVYLVRNGKAVIQRIKVERYKGNLAIISQGLKGNEEIITILSPDLNEGTAVTVS